MRPVLSLRPYRHGDFDEIEPRADFAAEQAALGWPLRRQPPPGHAWTATRDGAPIGCGGYAPRHEDGWEGWLYLACLSRREWAHVIRMARATLQFMQRRHPAPVIASALVDSPPSLRTLARLDFAPDGHRFLHNRQIYARMIREAR